MNPIYHIRLNTNPDERRTVSIDLNTLVFVGRPRRGDRVWSPSFTIEQIHVSDHTRIEFTGWETMNSERQLLVDAWEAWAAYKAKLEAENRQPMRDKYISIDVGGRPTPVRLTNLKQINHEVDTTGPNTWVTVVVEYFGTVDCARLGPFPEDQALSIITTITTAACNGDFA